MKKAIPNFVMLNGRLVPQAEAKVSVFDRGFLYGDGLFEAVRVLRGRPFLWKQHIRRLKQGAHYLGIKIPFTEKELEAQAKKLIVRNKLPDSILRMTLSRGVGRRGYSPKGADSPTFVMSISAMPPDKSNRPVEWSLITAAVRLPAGGPLAPFKTCNKLAQIMARAEADSRGADEALLLNTDGNVAEGSSSNVFWITNGSVCTPPLEAGILAGVTRRVVPDLCKKLGIPAKEKNITPKMLAKADGVFLSLSSIGIVEAVALDGVALKTSETTAKIRNAYADVVAKGSRSK